MKLLVTDLGGNHLGTYLDSFYSLELYIVYFEAGGVIKTIPSFKCRIREEKEK